MKKFIIAALMTYTLSSCSGISGKYSEVNIGHLGMNNSVSTYEFGVFGSVKYSLSTSGSRSSNSYKSHNGNFKVDGNKIIMNFGGSDRLLFISDDQNTLTDQEGNNYIKQ